MEGNHYLTTAQKSIATTVARAATLLSADGYTIEPYRHRPGIYSVARPLDDKRPLKKGETLWNDVDFLNQDCTCECFRHRGTCKHLIATNKAVAEAARLMGPMLPAPKTETACPPAERAAAARLIGRASEHDMKIVRRMTAQAQDAIARKQQQ